MLENIGEELGRRRFNNLLHSIHKRVQRRRNRFADMRIGEGYFAGQASRIVAPAHAPRECFRERHYSSYRYLPLLGSALADAELELASHKINDVIVEAVAGNVRALGRDDALERDDGDVGRA